MTTVRRLRVFLASPGDVGEERGVAREILVQLPDDPFLGWKVVFQVVAWDQPGAGPPLLATMTPQAAIAAGLPKPADCDIVVIILWSRIGTPLPDEYRKPDGSRYRSGTEWEYLNALQAAERNGKPIVLVYRRTEECRFNPTDPDYGERQSQLQQLRAFFADFSSPDGSIRRGWNDYVSPQDFRKQFEQHLKAIAAKQLAMPGEEREAAERAESGFGIEGAEPRSSTTTAGFVGPTERGPVRPQLIVGWKDYVQTFGEGLHSDVSFLSHAVRGYFDNGGGRVYIARVLGKGASTAAARIASGDGGGFLVFEARSPGQWGNRLSVQVRRGTRVGIRITVQERLAGGHAAGKRDRPLDDYDNLGLDPAGPNFAVEAVNDGPRRSAWVRCKQAPARFELAGAGSEGGMLAGGSDGAPLDASDYCGMAPPSKAQTGLWALAELEDVALLSVPDQVHPHLSADDRDRIAREMIAQCESVQDRFALLSIEQGRQDPASIRPACDSSFGALYGPWIWVEEPGWAEAVMVPPTGHLAGIFARSDFERGVHRAPVGEELRGLWRDPYSPAVEFDFGPAETDALLRLGVNALRADPVGREVRVRSAVTMSIDERFHSIAQRRMASFIRTSISFGTRWARFEANDEVLWRRLTREISAFLESVWSSGALRGPSPAEAFFVRCDATTMTQEDIAMGRVICQVGLSLVEPPSTAQLVVSIDAAIGRRSGTRIDSP